MGSTLIFKSGLLVFLKGELGELGNVARSVSCFTTTSAIEGIAVDVSEFDPDR